MEWLAGYCPHRARLRLGRGSVEALPSARTIVHRQRRQAVHLRRRQQWHCIAMEPAYRRGWAKGISTLVVPKNAPGLSFGAIETKMGWHIQSAPASDLHRLPSTIENRLSEEDAGFSIAMAGLDGGRLNIAACSLGGAQAALDKALAYTADRKAFGQAINRFQALQFRLADMETNCRRRELFLCCGAGAGCKAHDAGKWSAMAKRFVTDTGFEVANGARHLLSGYGYLLEYGIEKLVRDLRVHPEYWKAPTRSCA